MSCLSSVCVYFSIALSLFSKPSLDQSFYLSLHLLKSHVHQKLAFGKWVLPKCTIRGLTGQMAAVAGCSCLVLSSEILSSQYKRRKASFRLNLQNCIFLKEVFLFHFIKTFFCASRKNKILKFWFLFYAGDKVSFLMQRISVSLKACQCRS